MSIGWKTNLLRWNQITKIAKTWVIRSNCCDREILRWKCRKELRTRRRKVLKLQLQTSQREASWNGGGSDDILRSLSIHCYSWYFLLLFLPFFFTAFFVFCLFIYSFSFPFCAKCQLPKYLVWTKPNNQIGTRTWYEIVFLVSQLHGISNRYLNLYKMSVLNTSNHQPSLWDIALNRLDKMCDVHSLNEHELIISILKID